MSPRTRLLTLFAGAAALAGLTYGFGRLALRARSQVAPVAQRASGAEFEHRLAAPEAWQRVLMAPSAPSDALDLALDLDGIFEAPTGEPSAVTARPSDRVPPASSADDEGPPSPDDLGRMWLAQATQSEHSFSEVDPDSELENLPAPSDDSSEPSADGERDSYS